MKRTKKTKSVPTEVIGQRWPIGLKHRVEYAAGTRGMTKFTVKALTDLLDSMGVPQDVGPYLRPEEVRAPEEAAASNAIEDAAWAAAGDPTLNCKTCGNPLVDGECWECG